jgi:hypothetical protein
MSLIRNVWVCCIFLVLIVGCIEEKIISPDGEIVKVTVDLQQGFEGASIRVSANEEGIFRAELSTSVPLAGPQAYFVTYLPRGMSQLLVSWEFPYQPLPSRKDSADVDIGDAEQYFIGLSAYGDMLNVLVQDSAFAYVK